MRITRVSKSSLKRRRKCNVAGHAKMLMGSDQFEYFVILGIILYCLFNQNQQVISACSNLGVSLETSVKCLVLFELVELKRLIKFCRQNLLIEQIDFKISSVYLLVASWLNVCSLFRIDNSRYMSHITQSQFILTVWLALNFFFLLIFLNNYGNWIITQKWSLIKRFGQLRCRTVICTLFHLKSMIETVIFKRKLVRYDRIRHLRGFLTFLNF